MIAIGAMPLCRARLLPDAVVALREHWPRALITITEGAHGDLIEPLRNGDLDLMIGALRDPDSAPDLTQQHLFDDYPCVIARAGHPLTRQRAHVKLRQLRLYPWIVAPQGAPLREQWRQLFAAMLTPPPAPIECGSVITIREILSQTDALTILSPQQVRLEIDSGVLAIVSRAPRPQKRTIGVTTRAAWRPTPIQRQFLDLLQDKARDIAQIE